MTTPTPADRWGVTVDEVRLFASGRSTNWWTQDIGRFNATGRVRYLAVTPSGSVLEIGPLERDDAEFVRDYLTEKGIDGRVLKLRKWTEQPHLPKCRRATPCRLCAPSATAAARTAT
jgi:hypothetical protein